MIADPFRMRPTVVPNRGLPRSSRMISVLALCSSAPIKHASSMATIRLRAYRGPASPSATQAPSWQDTVNSITNDTVVLQPKLQAGASDAEHQLFVIFPGANMSPENYKHLAHAIHQEATAQGRSNTWVAVAGGQMLPLFKFMSTLLQPAVKSPGSDLGHAAPPATPEEAAQQYFDLSIKAAAEQCKGFNLQQSMAGRFENVVVAAHSASAPMLADAAFKRAGGFIMLEGGWSHDAGSKLARCTGWAGSTRPVMVLAGQLDGQMPATSLVTDAAVCAWTAARQGALHAATRKPVVLVPGLNHAHVCGMPSMAHRGDLDSQQTPEATLACAARAVNAFLTVISASKAPSKPGSGGAADNAVAYLKSQVAATLQYLAAYADSVGAGDLVTAWETGVKLDSTVPGSSVFEPGCGPQVVGHHVQGLPYPAPAMLNIGVPMAGGRVYGKLKATSPMDAMAGLWSVGPLSHGHPVTFPLAASKVEEEAGAMQAMLARAARDAGILPESALDKLRIVVTVHPTLDGFLYSQPVMNPVPGGWVELVAHAFQHWAALEKDPVKPAGIFGMSHNLWLKLKGSAGLAVELRDVLHLPPLPQEQCQAVHVSARELNEATFKWALNAAPQDALARYQELGVPLEFADDQELQLSPVWVKESRMLFDVQEPAQAGADKPSRVVKVTSPVMNNGLGWMPGEPQPLPADPEMRRFWGGQYVKVISRAQALEWLMVGGLRQAAMPLEAGCEWGGVLASPAAPASAPSAA